MCHLVGEPPNIESTRPLIKPASHDQYPHAPANIGPKRMSSTRMYSDQCRPLEYVQSGILNPRFLSTCVAQIYVHVLVTRLLPCSMLHVHSPGRCDSSGITCALLFPSETRNFWLKEVRHLLERVSPPCVSITLAESSDCNVQHVYIDFD